MVMKQLGHDAPIACLATYICLETLADPTGLSSFGDHKQQMVEQPSQKRVKPITPLEEKKKNPDVSPSANASDEEEQMPPKLSMGQPAVRRTCFHSLSRISFWRTFVARNLRQQKK
jgi:hypothetical protein